MKRLLFKGFIKHYVGAIFKGAVKNDSGALLLKRAAITRIGPLTGFLFAVAALIFAYYSSDLSTEERLPILQALGACSAILGLMAFTFSISRTIAGQDDVIAYRLFLKKKISYEEIRQAKFNRLFGGCMELSCPGKMIRVPLDTRGFSEFYELLKQRRPELDLASVDRELQERTRLLESVGYRFSA